MKRYLAASLLALAGCAPRQVKAPEKHPVILPPITLESLLPRTPRSIAHRALDIETEMGFAVAPSCYEKLDKILEAAKRRIGKRMDGVEIMRTIDSLLRTDFRYEFSSDDITLLSHALSGDIIDCDTASLVYLAIAEQHKLPLKGISAPKHFFVRWDGDKTFNWETTSGMEEPDLHYVLQRNAHPTAVENGVYLRSLEDHEIIAMAYALCGAAHGKVERYEQAIIAFDKALALAPEYEVALNNKGVCLLLTKKYSEALACYDRVLEHNPHNAASLYNKAISLKNLKRLDEALECYDQALGLEPTWKGFFYKANILAELGRYKEAIPAYDRAAALNPTEESIFIFKGLCFAELGDYEKAVSALDQALAIAPDSSFAQEVRQNFLKKIPR